MIIKFKKMHGTGNDFILLNGFQYVPTGFDYKKLAVKLCRRHYGIGADGLIIVLAAENKSNEFRMRIFNPDGSEAEMCGNGIRCFTHFLQEENLTDKDSLKIETLAGVIVTKVIEDNGNSKLIKVNMGKPLFKPEEIPINIAKNINYVHNFEMEVEEETFKINCVSMGNPHTIIFTEDINKFKVDFWGSKIEKHELFPEKTNVEFIKIVSRDEIIMKVWERGAGTTLACGTGASAAVVAGIQNDYLNNKVKVHLPGGDLVIEWTGKDVFMSGTSEKVFYGEIKI